MKSSYWRSVRNGYTWWLPSKYVRVWIITVALKEYRQMSATWLCSKISSEIILRLTHNKCTFKLRSISFMRTAVQYYFMGRSLLSMQEGTRAEKSTPRIDQISQLSWFYSGLLILCNLPDVLNINPHSCTYVLMSVICLVSVLLSAWACMRL